VVGRGPPSIRLELEISRSAESVRRWWTEYPDDYRAADPAEQPFRILTIGRGGNERRVRTFWRMADGREVDWEETLEISSDGSWTYDIPRNAAGFRIHDRFTPRDLGSKRTRLVIESWVEPLTPEAVSALPGQLARMEALWRRIVPICERDAPGP
jgi:hypothetical protein